jgi:hypothetical protein
MTMLFTCLAAVTLSVSVHLAAATPTWLNEVYKLNLSESTQVYQPSDSNWVNETVQRYTTFHAPTYAVSIKPALASDVQRIVRFSSISLLSSSSEQD